MENLNIPDEFELSEREYRLCATDADVIAYRAACAAEKTEYELYDDMGEFVQRFKSAKECKDHLIELEEFLMEDVSGYRRESVVVDSGLTAAKKSLDSMIKGIKKAVSAKEYRFYLTGPDNFRKDIATIRKYKGNRDTLTRPKYLDDMREYLISEYDAKVINNREADDAVSVALWNGFRKFGVDCDVCLVSIDKDLKGTPGVHFNFVRREWVFIDEYTADYWLFCQAISGDRIDNIGGIQDLTKEFRERYNLPKRKGVGEKTAQKILDGSKDKFEMYERVLDAYYDWYGQMCLYKDWKGNNTFKSFVQIADENIELVFMERTKGVRWDEYRWNYILED